MTWKSRLSHELEHCFLYLNYSNDIAASDITVLHSSKMSLSVAAKRANQIWISLNGSTVSYKVGGLCSVCITPRSICLVLNMRLGKNWLFGVESQDYNQAMMELKLGHMNEWLVSVDEDVWAQIHVHLQVSEVLSIEFDQCIWFQRCKWKT